MSLKSIHKIFSIIAFLCISSFFMSTIIVEIFFDRVAIVNLKELIVYPGLFILVPSIIITAISGQKLATSYTDSKVIQRKQKRMPIIALNGIVLLIPCAIFLYIASNKNQFDILFYTVQSVELIAGCINLVLMGLNYRDGKNIKRECEKLI